MLAVKIDNTGSAQPHTGLFVADLVYVEEVEWGLTRLLALYATELPPVISPVRSARISDLDILAPYGRVAFAYSGAQERLRPLLRKANLVNLPEGKVPQAWSTEPWRPVSWNNHALDARELMGTLEGVATAKDVGLRFASAVPSGGKSVRALAAAWPDSSIEFVWNTERRGFEVNFNGAESRASEGGPQVATTVVFQHVKQSLSGYGDRYGGKTPLVETIGSGRAWIARNGKVWEGSWTRPDALSGTRYLGTNGQVVPFAAGQVWVVLLDKDRPVSMR